MVLGLIAHRTNFWLGANMVIGGVGLICVGNVDHGIELVVAGVGLMVGREVAGDIVRARGR